MQLESSDCGLFTPTERQQAALITLLADEDPAVYGAVRRSILACGRAAAGWLHPHALSDDPLVRRRVRSLLRHFAGQENDLRFLAFCLQHGEEFDLENAAWLLAATAYPDINVEGCQALLDDYAAQLRARIGPLRQPGEVLGAINEFLFDELEFRGGDRIGSELEDLYLNRVLDRRTGDPVNLCLLYLLLGRRLHLPLAGIGVPGYFLCRYQTSSGEVYIDVYNRGRLLTRADCVQHLLPAIGAYAADIFGPASSRCILLRNCDNMRRVYLQLGRTGEATRVQQYLVALRG